MKLDARRFAALLALVGCSPSPLDGAGNDVSRGEARQALVLASESTSADDAVVLIQTHLERGSPFCTGTLVAENLLLTAAHCVVDYENTDTGCETRGVAGATGSRVTHEPAPSSIAVYAGLHPTEVGALGKKILLPDDEEMCLNDIAFVVLDRSIAAPIAPLRLDAAPIVGERVHAVGWGAYEGATKQERRRKDDLTVLALGPGRLPLTRSAALPERHLAIGATICWGDSGGPVFAESGAVLGVSAKLRSDILVQDREKSLDACLPTEQNRVFGLHTRVDAFRPLAMRAFEAAGSEPWLEGQPRPGEHDVETTRCDAGASACGEPVAPGASSTAPTASSGCATSRATGSATGSLATLVALLLIARSRRVGPVTRRPQRARL